MSTHTWQNIGNQLEHVLPQLNADLASDEQLRAFATTGGLDQTLLFAWASSGSTDGVLCSVRSDHAHVTVGDITEAAFILTAKPEHWQQFYDPHPRPPFQSYWGMFGQNIHQDGVEVHGNEDLFLALAPIWRRVLDISHTALCGPLAEELALEHHDIDVIDGKYMYADLLGWGKTKIFYEQSGDREKPAILFMHTAGSDGRQYHGVMNHPEMLKKCHMTVFDMPGHGRSFPGTHQIPGRHSNTEDAYIGIIRAVIKGLGLNKPIVCGASMAGHVSLAVAIRADEVGAGAVIPCQACDFTDMKRNHWVRSLHINQSLFNPEYVYGMMSPFSPLKDRNLLWHTYSGQAFSIYHGDLDFYFGGWDGRGRVEKINTQKCPVYMLTGDYDWSTTPAMSEATAKKIPGAVFKTMKGLGHFPATENPQKFVGYLIEAIDYVLTRRGGTRSVL